MIRYTPLWKTMDEKGETTYTIRNKGISSSTVQSLKSDLPVSTYTIDRLCTILDCGPMDIMEYIPDEKSE